MESGFTDGIERELELREIREAYWARVDGKIESVNVAAATHPVAEEEAGVIESIGKFVGMLLLPGAILLSGTLHYFNSKNNRIPGLVEQGRGY